MTPKLQRRLPLFGTISILLLLLIVASLLYPHFCSLRNAVNILADQAGMGVIAVGMTLVIFSGGIDLSVGAVAG
jgi:ribose/xylose/arabinose/galactoside ABC-type transport system permease subunit